jgi:uncharacterized protein (TIGR02996 family)
VIPPEALAAILADPADDLPRLQAADWLDDHAAGATCQACAGHGRVAGGRTNWTCERCRGSRRVALTPMSSRACPACRGRGSFAGPATMVCPDCGGEGTHAAEFRARAEFIRVQVEIADQRRGRYPASEANDRRQDELEGRVSTILARYQARWLRAELSARIPAARVSQRARAGATFVRGFVGRLSLPGSDLWGWVCGLCAGTGRLFSGRPDPDPPCYACKGRGSTGAGLAAVFRVCPVESVEPQHARPADPGDLIPGGIVRDGHHYFWRESDAADSLPWELPPAVFARLEGGHVAGRRGGRGPTTRDYPSRAAAELALSAALVALGREWAGLPPVRR